jgi:hypothetical protein
MYTIFSQMRQHPTLTCRWLPRGHRFRRDVRFGEGRGKATPPEPRNHAECVEEGKASTNWTGHETRHPRHQSGIDGTCALIYLHLFDIVWDICPDMMHIIKNFFEKLTFQLFSGDRVPNWSASKNKEPEDKTAPDYADKMARYNEAKALWELAVKANKKCIFTEADQKLVDRRIKNLVGPANWIKNSMVHELCTFDCLFCSVCI